MSFKYQRSQYPAPQSIEQCKCGYPIKMLNVAPRKALPVFVPIDIETDKDGFWHWHECNQLPTIKDED